MHEQFDPTQIFMIPKVNKIIKIVKTQGILSKGFIVQGPTIWEKDEIWFVNFIC